jgi:hypothetical protein
MRRAAILAAALLASAAPARAQTLLTIDAVRGMAAAGKAPSNSDMGVLRKCPGLRLIIDLSPAEVGELMQTARASRIDGGALWLRRNDAAIEACLARLPASERAQNPGIVPPLDLQSPAALANQNAYLLARAMNEHKAEIGAELKRLLLAMSDAEKARLEERARGQSMTFEALAVMQVIAPFAGVSVTDYEAFRAYLQMSGWSGGK